MSKELAWEKNYMWYTTACIKMQTVPQSATQIAKRHSYQKSQRGLKKERRPQSAKYSHAGHLACRAASDLLDTEAGELGLVLLELGAERVC
jgi:hypothetical protein